MGANDKKVLKTDHKAFKHFSYQKGNVKFDYDIRTDIKQDLKDAIECAERFIEEAKVELKKIK